MPLKINIAVDQIEYAHIETVLKKMQRAYADIQSTVDRNVAMIVEELKALIIGAIAEQHPLGDWMAERTKVDIAAAAGTIEIIIHGRKESELAGQAKTKDYDLWATHEFGAFVPGFSSSGPDAKYIVFQKETGTSIIRRGRKSYNIVKYKGRIANNILPAIDQDIRRQVMMMAAAVVESQLIKASGNMLDFDEAEFLNELRTNTSELRELNIQQIMVNSTTGQINLRGGGGRFQSHGNTNIPSRVNLDSSSVKFRLS